jgi:hypothetical protein
MELLIGADPEIWIKDLSTKKIISADGLFPGTKENPYKVTHGAIQVDGMAAEFNINPASTQQEFVRNILSVMKDLRDEIAVRNPDLEFEFVFSPVVEFGEEYIQAQPEHAKLLGCTPDFDAYQNGAPNPTPDADMPFRTASGHIHLGWGAGIDIEDPEHIEACCMMSQRLDIDLGLDAAYLEGKVGKKRRDLYGKAGAFRPKSYGVEYRTMSNMWLKNTSMMAAVFITSHRSFNNLIKGRNKPPVYDVQSRINSGDGRSLRQFYYLKSLSQLKTPLVSVKTLDELLTQAERNILEILDF